MVHVHLGADLRRFSGGISEVDVEAGTVRRLIMKLEAQFPGIGTLLEGSAVAIDGEVVSDPGYERLPEGAEVHFVPAPVGG